MEKIRQYWKEILIGLLIIFGMNKCTVACNRDTKINNQKTEIIQKDSIIKTQFDSLNILNVRWDENQKGQKEYHNLATGTKQELTETVNNMENTIKSMQIKIQTLTNENNNLKKENKKLKEQLNN